MGLTEHLNTKSSVGKRSKALARLYAQRRLSWIAANPRLGKWRLLAGVGKRAIEVSCVCDCGARRKVLLKDIKAGKSRSCGCNGGPDTVYATAQDKKLAKAINQWKVRCCYPGAASYKWYGGRGIEFRFSSIKEAFDWTVEHIGYPPEGRSIDRIDNDCHYEPGNLRWATRSEQMLNRRKWKWSAAARLRYPKLRATASLRRKRKTSSQF